MIQTVLALFFSAWVDCAQVSAAAATPVPRPRLSVAPPTTSALAAAAAVTRRREDRDMETPFTIRSGPNATTPATSPEGQLHVRNPSTHRTFIRTIVQLPDRFHGIGRKLTPESARRIRLGPHSGRTPKDSRQTDSSARLDAGTGANG
ncbi:exported hypothetical protein [Rhodococcus sp. RD6.2]|nr:exported hypothetical protein [Rhodococcus sp. RD6.2]